MTMPIKLGTTTYAYSSTMPPTIEMSRTFVTHGRTLSNKCTEEQ